MGEITYVLDNGLELTYGPDNFKDYSEFFNVLALHIKKENLTVKSIIKVSDQGSTTTFNLTFDN